MVAALSRSLAKQVDKGRLDEADADAVGGRVSATSDLDDLADCDLVIESVVEDLDVKKELFVELDRIVKDDAILATNTSTLPVVEMAVATGRPEQVCGIHFFNPAPMMALVEVIRPLTVERRDHRRRRSPSPRPAARTPSRSRTGPASSSTPCCSRTSTTRCGCWRTGTASRERHRRRHEGRLQLPDGAPRPARPGRARHVGRHPRRPLRRSSATRTTPRSPCCGGWSPPATSAGSRARASTTTAADPAAPGPARRGPADPGPDDAAEIDDRRRQVAALAASARRAGRRAVVSGRWLADTVVDVAPRLPVRDARGAVRPPRRADRRRSGPVVVRGAGRGARAGSAPPPAAWSRPRSCRSPGWCWSRSSSPPSRSSWWPSRSSWSPSSTTVAGRQLPGGPRRRAEAAVVSWMSGRAAPPDAVVAAVRGDVLGRAGRAELRAQLRARLTRNLTALATAADRGRRRPASSTVGPRSCRSGIRVARDRRPQPADHPSLDRGGSPGDRLPSAAMAPRRSSPRRAGGSSRPATDADDDGVVGVGADLEPGTILAAYRHGLFPMPLGAGRHGLGWWSPDPRGVLPLDRLRVSRSLRRSVPALRGPDRHRVRRGDRRLRRPRPAPRVDQPRDPRRLPAAPRPRVGPQRRGVDGGRRAGRRAVRRGRRRPVRRRVDVPPPDRRVEGRPRRAWSSG